MTTHENRMQQGDPQYGDPQKLDPQYGQQQNADPQQYGQPAGLQQNDSPFDDTPRGTEAPLQQPVPQTAVPSSEPESQRAHSDSADAELSLFGETEMSGFRARWNDVQAGFVDDPKQCVQTADALVAEVVDQLTAGFSEARARMEAQWARGEDASTEDLRLALKRYREFFQRLLSV